MTSVLSIDPLRCPACGADNRCAVAAGGAIGDCWCWQAPRATPAGGAAADATQCYCTACLAARRPAEAAHAR